MRKFLWLFCLSLLFALPLGCAPAKKPAPAPQPKTIVVPDVSRITFETMDYDKAPEIVKVLGNTLQDKHFAVWTSVNGRNYVVVSQRNLPAGRGIQITEIERRLPANDFDWINVKLKYLSTTPGSGPKTDTEKPLVASFTMDRPVKALGFEIEREVTPSGSPAPVVPAAPKEKNETDKGLKLDTPTPGEQVKSPLQVSGTAAGVAGQVRIRIKNAAGLTLAEKPVTIQGGKFAATMGFSPPAGRERGSVEAFVTGDEGVEKDTVSVPVVLLPAAASEAEPIGAP
ncbi:hypothetical protein JCM39194_01760 [Desulfotomaculum varum]